MYVCSEVIPKNLRKSSKNRGSAPHNVRARLYFLDFSCEKYVWARYCIVTLKVLKQPWHALIWPFLDSNDLIYTKAMDTERFNQFLYL